MLPYICHYCALVPNIIRIFGICWDSSFSFVMDLPSQQEIPAVAWCRAFMCKGRAIMFWLLCCTLAFYCSRGYLCRAWPPSVSEMHSHVLALGAGCVAASSKPAFPPHASDRCKVFYCSWAASNLGSSGPSTGL